MTLQAVALFVVFLLTNNYTQLHRNYFLRKPGGRVVNTAGGGGGGGERGGGGGGGGGCGVYISKILKCNVSSPKIYGNEEKS